MYLLLLIVGALVLATACGLLQASAMRSRKLRKLSAPHTQIPAPRAPTPALSPQARQQAIQAYRAIQDMALSDAEEVSTAVVVQRQASTAARPSPARKVVPTTPKIARMRWQQRGSAISSQ